MIEDPETLLAHLDAEEARIIRFRAGLVDGSQHSTAEIAGFLGVRRGEAREREHAAWRKLFDLAQSDATRGEAVRMMARRCHVSWRRIVNARPD